MSNIGEMNNDRTLCLVKGYHEHSYPPNTAHTAGLHHRFAIILDSYRRDKIDMFFDRELFLSIITGISSAIKHDVIEIDMEEGERFNTIDELSAFYNQLEEVEQEPPTYIKFILDNQLICLEETEFWTRSGGPEPYHDSYTLSFYTKDDHTETFHAISLRKSAELGAVITGLYEAQLSKEPRSAQRSWLQRLLGV